MHSCEAILNVLDILYCISYYLNFVLLTLEILGEKE